MKVADLKPGATYVGKNGRRRYIHEIGRMQCDGRPLVEYDVPEGGGVRVCRLKSFAHWAEREAEPHERAP